MKRIIDWLEKKNIYFSILLLCIALLILSLVFFKQNDYWSEATINFGFALIILIAFRNSTKPIRPYGERDTIKKMLSMAGRLDLYRELSGALSLVLMVLGIRNVVLGALSLLISEIIK